MNRREAAVLALGLSAGAIATAFAQGSAADLHGMRTGTGRRLLRLETAGGIAAGIAQGRPLIFTECATPAPARRAASARNPAGRVEPGGD